MGNLVDLVFSNTFTMVGASALLCGVALFYLVMARTIKHREMTSETQD